MDRPTLTDKECEYLVTKTNQCPTTTHQDRNNMTVVVNKLILMSQWVDPKAPPKKPATTIKKAVKKAVKPRGR